jgi:hypothetical protein
MKAKIGPAERKFREREQKKNRSSEQDGARLLKDLERAADCLFLGISLGLGMSKRKRK